MLTLTTAVRNAVVNALVSLITPGSYIELRSGVRPVSPDQPATGVIIAQISLTFPVASNGQSIASDTTPAAVQISETASWFRLYSAAAVVLWDGDISLTNQGGDLQFSNLNFTVGQVLVLNNLKLIEPA